MNPSASSTAVGVSHPFSEEQRGHLFLHSPEKWFPVLPLGLKRILTSACVLGPLGSQSSGKLFMETKAESK